MKLFKFNLFHSYQVPIKRLVPILSPEKSYPSKGYNKVDFTHSDWKVDAAQTTVPFIDAQSLSFGRAVPLSGVGIYHKGYGDYAGFIAPRIFNYNYNQVI